MRRIDLDTDLGRRFNRWTVIPGGEWRSYGAFLLCVCDCGQERLVERVKLKGGKTKSCGCLRNELTAARGRAMKTHGETVGIITVEYRTWSSMRKRCLDPKTKYYYNYGGRGIGIDKRWDSFPNFLEDMGRRPSPLHSLDRVDSNGDYSPLNCRWSTRSVQARNKRNNSIFEFNGERKVMAEWAEIVGVKAKTLEARVTRFGWSIEKALTTECKGIGSNGTSYR